MTCVECRKNRADQMKELLCDNKEKCREAYQAGYNQALEDFANKINKMLKATDLRDNGYYVENLVSIAKNELTK